MASDLVASPFQKVSTQAAPDPVHVAHSAIRKNLALIHMSLDKRAEKIKQVESDQRTAAQRQRDRETLLRGEIDALLPSADVTLHAERTLLESHTVGRVAAWRQKADAVNDLAALQAQVNEPIPQIAENVSMSTWFHAPAHRTSLSHAGRDPSSILDKAAAAAVWAD